jgi:hypothetical protein
LRFFAFSKVTGLTLFVMLSETKHPAQLPEYLWLEIKLQIRVAILRISQG